MINPDEKREALKIVVRFPPVALQRPRLSKYKVYDPQSQLKSQIACLIRPQISQFNFVGNLSLGMTFYFEIPNSWSIKKKEKVAAKRKGSRPDLSNCIKFYEDIMQDMGIYKDDAQIVEIHAKKLYDDGQGARVEIILKEINGEESNT